MSTLNEKKEVIKAVLRELHSGVSLEVLKERFKEFLKDVSPMEIPLIEQELVREGVPIQEIIKLCDLHVALFRDFLISRELEDVPRGHPLNLLLMENEYLLKKAEVLNIYALSLSRVTSEDEKKALINNIRDLINDLRKIRVHYRKIQMLIFPYLEKRGISAVPRVLWAREDEIIVKLRGMVKLLESNDYAQIASKASEIANGISEIIFRENKILFPAVWVLLSEGEWAAISDEANKIGWLVNLDVKWTPREKPTMPYEVKGVVSGEVLEKLPQEMKIMALAGGIKPDEYELIRSGDLNLETGFINLDELKSLIKSLPLEVTFADVNDRVRFFSEGKFHKGFARSKNILGRRVEYCHPPRLEAFIKKVLNELKSGAKDYEVFWTKMGDRIIRVMVVALRNDEGKYLGALEIVEDLTEIVENPEEVKKKILVI
ncbi:MAG: DUF438 domain-containing protein [archaeon YNP-LCB-024-027]|jgi:DUF438 domain-containing protein|nr:DUF438 domain-containing protein [Candidatus Culexarchaeum yellowstonense]